jgi:hypothetical protein
MRQYMHDYLDDKKPTLMDATNRQFLVNDGIKCTHRNEIRMIPRGYTE